MMRLKSVLWQIAALTLEFLIVAGAYCVYIGELTAKNLILSACLASVFALYFKIPKGWDTDQELIDNGRNRCHDAVLVASILVFVHIATSYAIAFAFLSVFE